ncbi:hypothetical protein HDU67_005491 [Dinochytrium kinnereticum]|nr:hypothetical protein HDU67_005491 [Dinochytrium kinnereticum]
MEVDVANEDVSNDDDTEEEGSTTEEGSDDDVADMPEPQDPLPVDAVVAPPPSSPFHPREIALAAEAVATGSYCQQSSPNVFQDPLKPNLKRIADEIEDRPEAECTICSDTWTNYGPHRLCSLKCGHLFGEKAPAKRSDIRRIFANCLVAVDSVVLDQALQEKNRLKREIDFLVKENARLQSDRQRFLKELNALRCPPVTLYGVVIVSRQKNNARVAAYEDSRSKIFDLASTVNGETHGFDVFTAEQPKQKAFFGLHSGPVRDCKIVPSRRLLLSGSADKASLHTIDESGQIKKQKDLKVDPGEKVMDVIEMADRLGVLTESKVYIWDTKSLEDDSHGAMSDVIEISDDN